MMGRMSIRECRATDLPVEGAPWLVSDDEFSRGRSLVEVEGDRIVAAGLRPRSRATDLDMVELFCVEGYGEGMLSALAAEGDRPILLRVLPGTPTAAAVARLGDAEVVQSLPAAAVPTGHPEVHAWVRARLETAEQQGVQLGTGRELGLEALLDLWVEAYLPMHERWAPVTDVEALREGFDRWFAGGLDTEHTFVATAEGDPVAATFLVGELDGVVVPCMVEVQRDHPAAETAAAASMAAVLEAVSPRPVEFEGHVDEPVYMRILESIPQRAAGQLTPMDIVRIEGATRPG